VLDARPFGPCGPFRRANPNCPCRRTNSAVFSTIATVPCPGWRNGDHTSLDACFRPRTGAAPRSAREHVGPERDVVDGGESQSKDRRGRVLSSSATDWRASRSCTRRSVPLTEY
jgi:hypothetical protein